jgi:hypothetical protein
VPQRRLTGLALALIASLTLVATGAMASCSIDIPVGDVSGPFSQAPVPSASVGQPAYVCTAVYKILTDGAATLTNYVGGSSDSAKQHMRDALSAMASKVTLEGERTSDTALRTAIDQIAGRLTDASKLDDPRTYIKGDFQTVSNPLDANCA